MSYYEMVTVLLHEHVSDTRQLQAKGTLEVPCLRKFMHKSDIVDVSLGLTKLVEHINELVPQCLRDFRTDAHEIDYLRKAVMEFHS